MGLRGSPANQRWSMLLFAVGVFLLPFCLGLEPGPLKASLGIALLAVCAAGAIAMYVTFFQQFG